jgi:hypothetical protein
MNAMFGIENRSLVCIALSALILGVIKFPGTVPQANHQAAPLALNKHWFKPDVYLDG